MNQINIVEIVIGISIIWMAFFNVFGNLKDTTTILTIPAPWWSGCFQVKYREVRYSIWRRLRNYLPINSFNLLPIRNNYAVDEPEDDIQWVRIEDIDIKHGKRHRDNNTAPSKT